MVLIMTTAWCPPDKYNEVEKIAHEVQQKTPIDPYIGKLLARGTYSDKDGVKQIIIIEGEKGKLEEALVRTARRQVGFFGIEGFRFEVKTERAR